MKDLFKDLRENLSGNVAPMISEMFPNGKRHGDWWRIGNIQGEKSKSGVGSLAINLTEGNFIDHSTGDKGDFIKLYQEKHGYSKPLEAAKSIADRLGISYSGEAGLPATRKSQTPKVKTCKTEKREEKSSTSDYKPVIYKTPAEWTLPDWVIGKQTEDPNHLFHQVYYYRNKDRTIHHTVLRINYKDGKKSFRQFHFDGGLKYKKPDLLIPYNLPNLDEGKTVIIYEGEKCVHAGFDIDNENYSHTTGSGGSKNLCKTDWSYLKGKDVIIWPDNDESGKKACMELAKKLDAICSVSIVSVPEDKPEKWDVADSGLNQAEFEAFLLLNTSPYTSEDTKTYTMPATAKHKFSFRSSETGETTSWYKDVPVSYDEDMNEIPHFDQVPIEAYDIEPPQPTAKIINIEQKKRGRPKKKLSPDQLAFREIWARLGLSLKTNGEPHQNEANIMKIFKKSEMKNMLWLDEFYARPFIKMPHMKEPKEIQDDDLVEMFVYMQSEYGMHSINYRSFKNTALAFAGKMRRNQVHDWIDSLKWDGVRRCDTFWHKVTGCEDNAYTMGVSRYFWMSLINRIYDPGCKVDSMVILEGEQGTAKSEIGKILGVKHGPKLSHTKYFCDDLPDDFGSPEWRRQLQGFYLCEIAELSAFNKSDANKIKKNMTVTSDSIRGMHKDFPVRWPRKCIFMGTTNDQNYLKDPTGARRFLPIKCDRKKDLDTEYVAKWRDQFFAEAKARFDSNETSWWEVPGASSEQKKRSELNEDIAVDTIREWVSKRGPESYKELPLTNVNIFRHCLDNPDPDRQTPVSRLPFHVNKKIRAAMLHLGFDHDMKQVKRAGSVFKVWSKEGEEL